jgi:hypothetical protein
MGKKDIAEGTFGNDGIGKSSRKLEELKKLIKVFEVQKAHESF